MLKRTPRLAKTVLILAVLSLWGLATPAVSNFLVSSLEQDSALLPTQLKTINADAIVILSARQNERALEFGQPVSGADQLSRLRYGAFLYHNSTIPILLSGGSVMGNEKRSLAETMSADLAQSFGIKARWLESKSRTTAENARYSYAILSNLNKKSIILITSSLHMKRAKWSFEQAGFHVLPAPTNFIDQRPLSVSSFLPSAQSLNLSSDVIHEWLGYWAYRALEF